MRTVPALTTKAKPTSTIKMKPSPKQTAAGFTMLEALIASSILSIAITGITLPFVAGQQHQREDANLTLATSLGQELMEEILSRDFSDQGMGSEPDETNRGQYDCINDYNGYTEISGQITSNCGNHVEDPASVGLSRHVVVTYVAIKEDPAPQTPQFATVIVEIRKNGQVLTKLSRLVYSLQ